MFEYLEGTVLDELEKMPGGLGDERTRERIYQVTRAINFCHSNHVRKSRQYTFIIIIAR